MIVSIDNRVTLDRLLATKFRRFSRRSFVSNGVPCPITALCYVDSLDAAMKAAMAICKSNNYADGFLSGWDDKKCFQLTTDYVTGYRDGQQLRALFIEYKPYLLELRSEQDNVGAIISDRTDSVPVS